MTSLSVLQSSWLYLYHFYQLYPLEKETNRCEWVKKGKLAVIHEFWTWDSNPYLNDSNRYLLGSIFLTFWNLDSNPYLGDSNRPSHLAFCSSKWSETNYFKSFWTLSSFLSKIDEAKKCPKHGQKCPSFSKCRSRVSSFKGIRIADKEIRIALPYFSFLHFLELRFESYP